MKKYRVNLETLEKNVIKPLVWFLSVIVAAEILYILWS